MGIHLLLPAPSCSTAAEVTALTRIAHERLCCNPRSAATMSLPPAGSPLGLSTYCTSMHRVLTPLRAGLATQLSEVSTNRHK
jgi:hypothetical protein